MTKKQWLVKWILLAPVYGLMCTIISLISSIILNKLFNSPYSLNYIILNSVIWGIITTITCLITLFKKST
jgi:hypothetical protein